MSLRTPRQRPHWHGDPVPRRSLLMAEMKWWQSRKLPGRGGRVRGLLSPSWSKSDRDRREVIGKLVILASEGIGKIYVSMGTRITSIDDLIRKATPWGAGDSQRDGNSSASTG